MSDFGTSWSRLEAPASWESRTQFTGASRLVDGYRLRLRLRQNHLSSCYEDARSRRQPEVVQVHPQQPAMKQCARWSHKSEEHYCSCIPPANAVTTRQSIGEREQVIGSGYGVVKDFGRS
jgi:hypothetical protein